MSAPAKPTSLAAVLASGLLIASAAGLQAARERLYPAPAPSPETLYVASGDAIRRLSLGYHTLAADLYWIRAVQYYGGTKLRLAAAAVTSPPAAAADGAYPLLYPLLDVTTTLDPRFNIAYRFGAIFLAEAFPGGAGRPDLALALLEKGLRERPDSWQYMQDAGFVHYWWRHDYTAAADWFRRASETPGAPWWLQSLAATTLSEGGDRESSRRMWQAIRESAEIDWLKRDAERRLRQLDALDQMDTLQQALDEAGRRGLAAADWAAVVRARALPGIPVDPAGVAYELADGRVQLSRQSPLFPLPTEPQRLRTFP